MQHCLLSSCSHRPALSPTARADTGVEIARSLGLAYAMVVEFHEYRSSWRSARSQGGGVHGNAILSRFDIDEARPGWD